MFIQQGIYSIYILYLQNKQLISQLTGLIENQSFVSFFVLFANRKQDNTIRLPLSPVAAILGLLSVDPDDGPSPDVLGKDSVLPKIRSS